jgi:hypothetical protein
MLSTTHLALPSVREFQAIIRWEEGEVKTYAILAAIFIELGANVTAAQWVQTAGSKGGRILCLSVSGPNLYAGCYAGGILLSTNAGKDWTSVTSNLADSVVSTIAVSGGSLFAGTEKGIFMSTNNGASWTAVNNGLTFESINVLYVNGINLFAGTNGGGLFLSTVIASNWTSISDGLVGGHVSGIAVSNGKLFAGTEAGVYVSTNSGTTWKDANNGLTNASISALAEEGPLLFAGVIGHGVYESTTGGLHWTDGNNGLTSLTPTGFVAYGPNVFFGSEQGVFLSRDNGTTWTKEDSGLTNLEVRALAIVGSDLFCGTWGNGVWKRPISELITGVNSEVTKLPKEFVLKQNHPNPFNPSTTIQYQLPTDSMVRLNVYDIFGREVSVLVNERKNAGSYGVKFEGKNLASGVYFYRLQAGDFTQTRRLLLLK